MTFLRLLLILMIQTFAVLSLAQSPSNYTLIDEATGVKYRCSQVTGGGSADPACVTKLRGYCKSNTTYSANECFDRATTACGFNSDVKDCVPKTQGLCRSTTSYSAKECFDRAVISCGGR